MDEDLDVGSTPPEESGNRVFLIGTIILGGVFVLALVAIVVIFLLTRGGGQVQPLPADLTATAAFQLGGTKTAAAKATQLQQASLTAAITATWTPTRTITRTTTPTKTPVVFSTLAATNTPESTGSPSGTPTADATQLGTPGKTGTPSGTITPAATAKATALPATGFADSAGLPGLLALGSLLLVVIIVARQLRVGNLRR
jgi:hypothetical protein